jgi:hypothetical protein
MRVACLVLAYSGAAVLVRSIEVFRLLGWDVYVHVDAKVDRLAYLRELGDAGHRCFLIDTPVNIFWAGYSMVEAELELIRAAQGNGGYDKYVLISDDTFPAVPASALSSALEQKTDFITAVIQGPNSKVWQHYRQFFYPDHPLTTLRPIEPRSFAIDPHFERVIWELSQVRLMGKKDIKLYYGSQFWALSSQSLDFIRGLLVADGHLIQSFKYSIFSDEVLIQSIVGNYLHEGGCDSAPVYADFYSKPGKTNIFGSYESLPFDLHQHHLFVRKISPLATDFIDGMLTHLVEGRTIFGLPPDDPYSLLTLNDPFGRACPTITFRLGAPEDSGQQDPSWHREETYLQRRYRWTASSEIVWKLRNRDVPPGRARFYIPTAIGKPGFMENCTLSFAGQTKPMLYTRYSLIAEFEHSGLSQGATVVLKTRPTEPANPPHDDRLLGIGVVI